MTAIETEIDSLCTERESTRTGRLLLAVAIRDERVRPRLVEAIDSLRQSRKTLDQWGFEESEFADFSTLKSLADGLRGAFADTPDLYAVVVSDMLADQGKLDPTAKGLLEPFGQKPVVTMAVTSDGRRVPDIDRVIKPSADGVELADAFGLIAARLLYIGPTTEHSFRNRFHVRRIDDEYELAKYYKLRHRVYSVMGYMSERKEAVASGLEIDGCDCRAIHLGAFEQCEGYQELAGTARLLLANAGETHWAAWTRRLLRADRPLAVLVRNEALQLRLPVFQSQHLNDELQDALMHNLLCAELSRVIVAPEYRGAGLARTLVEAAISEARNAGVHRLYLECLRLHETLYSKFGFQTMPGTGEQVIGVNKSMIAMVKELADVGEGGSAAGTG